MEPEKPRIYAVRVPRNVGGINRVGQQCEALKMRHNRVHIRFADGSETVISRFLLKALPESAIVSPEPQMPV